MQLSGGDYYLFICLPFGISRDPSLPVIIIESQVCFIGIFSRPESNHGSLSDFNPIYRVGEILGLRCLTGLFCFRKVLEFILGFCS